MNVIEHESKKTLRQGDVRRCRASNSRFLDRRLISLGRESAWLFYFELSNYLRLTLIKDLEILFSKVSDGVPLRIANDGANHDQLHVHFECSGFVFRRDFGRVLRSVWRGWRIQRRSLRGSRVSRIALSRCRECRLRQEEATAQHKCQRGRHARREKPQGSRETSHNVFLRITG